MKTDISNLRGPTIRLSGFKKLDGVYEAEWEQLEDGSHKAKLTRKNNPIDIEKGVTITERLEDVALPFGIEAVGAVEMPAEVEFYSNAEFKVGDPITFSGFDGLGITGKWEVVKVCRKMITAVQRTKQ